MIQVLEDLKFPEPKALGQNRKLFASWNYAYFLLIHVLEDLKFLEPKALGQIEALFQVEIQHILSWFMYLKIWNFQNPKL
jgi:hypothetical protein